MALIEIITETPSDLFDRASSEINNIDWNKVNDLSRASGVFSTSTAIHLRHHKISGRLHNFPKTINDWCEIVECENGPAAKKFPETYKLSEWVCEHVGGIRLGRIMIVRLDPYGRVKLHLDPLTYFEQHGRYHIPVQTNPNVIFSGEDYSEPSHMPQKFLSRLNNRKLHQVVNDSDKYRIHLIVDVLLPNGNNIF